MTPELSRRVASVMSDPDLQEKLAKGQMHVRFAQAVEAADTFDGLEPWARDLVEEVEERRRAGSA